MSKEVTKNDYYRHTKTNTVYQVLHLAKIEATGEPVVVYCKPGLVNADAVWVRPVSEWFELVDLEDGQRRYRFEWCEYR